MYEICLRMMIVEESLKHLNKIAKVPNKDYDCFDCEQLINVIYRDLFGISIRKGGYGKSSTTKVLTSSIGQFYNLQSQEEKLQFISFIQPGDILFFHTQSIHETMPTPQNRYPGHVALYLKDGKMIHASASKGKVMIESLYDEDNLNILVGYKDIVSTMIKQSEISETQKRR